MDVIIDCAEGFQAYKKAIQHKVLKTGAQGGRFLAVVPHQWHIEMHHHYQMIGFMVPIFWRQFKLWMFRSSMPSYKMLFGAPRGNSLRELLDIVEAGRIRAILDPNSPHSFTTEGVRDAFKILMNRKGHGKIVIEIDHDEDKDQ